MNQESFPSSSIANTSSHELRSALFTFHRYHESFVLDDTQSNALQLAVARDIIINTSGVDVLSTSFLTMILVGNEYISCTGKMTNSTCKEVIL